jgi:hypothetical protein
MDVLDLFGGLFKKTEADYLLGNLSDQDVNKRFSGYYRSRGAVDFNWFDYKHYNEYKNANEGMAKALQRRRFIDSIIDHSLGISSYQYLGPKSDDKHRFHFLRTAIYWVISGKLHLAFVPDFIRIPIIWRYQERIRQSLRMFIARKVDERVRKDLQSAMVIASPMPIPVPNAVFSFLNMYSASGLEEAFECMREEFKEERKTIVDWESRIYRTDKTGYGEALKVMKEITSSLAALKKADWSEIALFISPGVVTDIISGTAGPSTTTSLIREGVNAIRRWTHRARISYFNNAKNEASNMQNQQHLFNNVFGDSLSSRQINRFLALSKSLDDLTQLQ